MSPPRPARPLRIALVTLVLVAGFSLPAVAAAAPAVGATSGLYHVTKTASANWAGFAVTGPRGSVTDVKGSWVEPKIQGTCPAGTHQYSSFWVGIDGVSSNTVEQTGTDSDCRAGSPSYYAWYEFYPHPSFVISTVPIHAGDTISAEVKWVTGTKFQLTLSDVTTSKSFSKTGSVTGAKRTSAEWIAEAPSSGTGILPLADFGTVSFGSHYTNVAATNTATVSGVSGYIGNFSAVDQIHMVLVGGGGTKAVTHNLSTNGSSFQTVWKQAGP